MNFADIEHVELDPDVIGYSGVKLFKVSDTAMGIKWTCGMLFGFHIRKFEKLLEDLKDLPSHAWLEPPEGMMLTGDSGIHVYGNDPSYTAFWAVPEVMLFHRKEDKLDVMSYDDSEIVNFSIHELTHHTKSLPSAQVA